MTVQEFVSKIMDVQRQAIAQCIDKDWDLDFQEDLISDIKEFEINDPDYKSELDRIISEFKEQL